MDDADLFGRALRQIEAATGTKGPRSLIRTFTDLPFSGFVTLTTEPIGSVLEAAVSALGLYTSPLVVFCPVRPGPYHEAFMIWLAGVGVAVGWIGCAIGGSTSGGGGAGAGRAAHEYR